MRYLHLGRTGIRVSEIALGAMRFGAPDGRGIDVATARRVFNAYADAGGNFIDTANVYNAGASERTLADLIATDRDHFVLGGKYGMAGEGGDIALAGGSRRAMTVCVEQSLRRLRTDRLDILYLHRWDFATPADEVMRGADDLVRQGKVIAIGLSNTPAWIAARAATIAELRGCTRPAAIQLPYHLLDRSAERELLPMARDLGIGVLAWAPLARGLLAGPGEGEPFATLARIAGKRGVPVARIALAWIGRDAACRVIPIVGAETVDQVRDADESTRIVLTPEECAELDRASPIDLGQPYGELSLPIYSDLLTAFQPDRLPADGQRAVR